MLARTVSTTLVAATATAPAAPYDLTDLATIHDELAIPTNDVSKDTYLQRSISQNSISIKKYCNRVFQVEAIQDLIYLWHDPHAYQIPNRLEKLQLSRWPLANTTFVAFTGTTDGATGIITGVSTVAGLATGLLVFGCGVQPGSQVTAFDPVELTVTLSLPTTAAGVAVSLSTGISVVENLDPTAPQPLVQGRDFVIDAEHGWLYRRNQFTGGFMQWRGEPVTVQYCGGYEQIPFDVELAALRMVTKSYWQRGVNPTLKAREQPSGREEFWVSTTPDANMTPDLTDILDNYRVPIGS